MAPPCCFSAEQQGLPAGNSNPGFYLQRFRRILGLFLKDGAGAGLGGQGWVSLCNPLATGGKTRPLLIKSSQEGQASRQMPSFSPLKLAVCTSRKQN